MGTAILAATIFDVGLLGVFTIYLAGASVVHKVFS